MRVSHEFLLHLLDGISYASTVAIECLRLRAQAMANQSESAAFRGSGGNPVCRLCAIRIHSPSRLDIFPGLRIAELARPSASL